MQLLRGRIRREKPATGGSGVYWEGRAGDNACFEGKTPTTVEGKSTIYQKKTTWGGGGNYRYWGVLVNHQFGLGGTSEENGHLTNAKKRKGPERKRTCLRLDKTHALSGMPGGGGCKVLPASFID